MSEDRLADKTCVPCQGGVPPLRGDDVNQLRGRLGDNWRVINDHHIERQFDFPDFASALAFTNAVGAVAESEGHHPDIYLAWGTVKIKIFTHKIDGLTESDFVLAAKIDQLPR